MVDEPGETLKEYRAAAAGDPEVAGSQPNVASSSVVLHLQVAQDPAAAEGLESHNYEREYLNYKPDVTLPCAYTEDDSFSVRPEGLVGELPPDADEPADPDAEVAHDPPAPAESAAVPACAPEEGTAYATRVTSVLRDFESKSNEGDWPLSTSVSCYWCCHQFGGPPLGLPVKPFPADDGYFVTGCFCSVACAAAFNLDSRESHDAVCDRQAMLSELSRLIHGTEAIRAAPDWKALQKFGGYMTVEQFRAFSSEDKVILANVPPMRSLTTQLEEVNEGSVGSGYNFVPLDPVRLERGMQQLTLRRNKPRFDYKNSLDHKMNVVIRAEN